MGWFGWGFRQVYGPEAPLMFIVDVVGIVVIAKMANRPRFAHWREKLRALFWWNLVAFVIGFMVGPWLLWPITIGALLLYRFHQPTRDRVARLRFRWRLPETIATAGGRAGVPALEEAPPSVVETGPHPLGMFVELQLKLGTTVEHLERAGEAIAASCRARAVRFVRHRDDASRVRMVVVRHDPLSGSVYPWPGVHARGFYFSRPIPVGMGEEGDVVRCGLVGHHLLIGGEPGAGKSNAMSLVLAAAALDPLVRLHLLDGKLVELSPWRSCAEHFVGPDLDEAVALIDELRAEMDARYERLLAEGRRKIEAGDGLGIDVVVCDELALYFNASNKDASKRFSEGFRDLVARGRAAGFVVIAATQKPSTDVIPSAVRDLFGYRWAMRCATREASDTVLGSGWSVQGYSAAEIDSNSRGEGWLLSEGLTPVRLRAFVLEDEDLFALAERGAALRSSEIVGGAA